MNRSAAYLTTDVATHAQVLTAAFTDDPMFQWVFPGPSHVDSLAVWWDFIVADAARLAGVGRAEMWSIDDGAAAAIWYPPGVGLGSAAETDDDEDDDDDDDDDVGAAGTAEPSEGDQDGDDTPNPFVQMVGGLVGDRIGEVLTGFGRISEAHPAEPHWYLPSVGTRPSHQGRGSGARLLQPVLDRCDQQGLPAYLESSNPRNVPFYYRLGFEVMGEIVVAEPSAVSAGASLTAMWRSPR